MLARSGLLPSLLLTAFAVVAVSSCGGGEFASPSNLQDAGASDGRADAGNDASSSHGGSGGSFAEAGKGGATSQGGSDGGAETGNSAGAAGAAGNCAPVTCYGDADGDGFGDPSMPDTSGCSACASGYVLDHTDCNDHPDYGANYHPGQTECFDHDPGGGWDFNCNGSTDPAVEDCQACGVPSVNPRWCDGACNQQVFKLHSNYAACGAQGRLTRPGQKCGDEPNCGGAYPLTNDVGAAECIQRCR